MVDPVAVSALVFGAMQFVLELKKYFLERKERRRPNPQLAPTSQLHITYYSICTYNILYPPLQYPTASYSQHQPHSYMLLAADPLRPSLPLQYSAHVHNSGGASHVSGQTIDANPSSMTNPHGVSARTYAFTPVCDFLGLLEGHLELHSHQQAPLSNTCYAYATLGMRTGACAYDNRTSCYEHWKSLQEETTHRTQSSIAVVDWSRGNIDMFVEKGGAYFRNYRISRCDVAAFWHLFRTREVFAGAIKEQKLVRCSKEMKMVEMRGTGVQSRNSWRSLLGIMDESQDMQEVVSEQRSFVKMVRGAVFGLVCCMYEVPSDLNVDMESTAHINCADNLDIVRITTHRPPCCIVKRNACIFSVYSFCDHGWASQDILLG